MLIMRRAFLASIVQFIPLATVIILVSGLSYVFVQQSYRSSANDPQIQMVIDARNALNGGATPQSLVPTSQIDIAQSQSPYLAIFDQGGQPLASAATLHGAPPVPPHGVFVSANTQARDVVTWQPEVGVRSAIVVMRYNNGYVLAGRSLQTIEDRETSLLQMAALGCLIALLLTFIMTFGVRLVVTRFPSADALS